MIFLDFCKLFVIAARPREGVLPRLQPHRPGVGREAQPRHLAGSLAV